MTVRGRDTYYDGKGWRWRATGELVKKTETTCPSCGESCGFDGPDPCLGMLPGVRGACCGHGDRDRAYITFENGLTIKGFTVDPS
jgi:hypothetical protein